MNSTPTTFAIIADRWMNMLGIVPSGPIAGDFTDN